MLPDRTAGVNGLRASHSKKIAVLGSYRQIHSTGKPPSSHFSYGCNQLASLDERRVPPTRGAQMVAVSGPQVGPAAARTRPPPPAPGFCVRFCC
jgi:hypothetical protein